MTYIGTLSGQSGSSSGVSSSGAGFSGGISGLASGLNTDSMVQGLMEAAQVPLVQLLQQRQITQWKQESYQRVNNTLNDLSNSLSSLQLQSTFLQNTSTSTNSSLVTVTPASGAQTASYSVQVYQLATGATVSSAGSLTNPPASAQTYDNTAIAQLSTMSGTTDANPSTISSSFTVNGESFAFNPQTDTVNSVLAKINGDSKAGVTGFYDSNTGKVVLQTTGTGSTAKIQVSGDTSIFTGAFGLVTSSSMTSEAVTGSPGADNTPQLNVQGSMDIGGVQYTLTSTETLGALQQAIHANATTTGVDATIVNGNQLQLTGTGLFSGISVSDPTMHQDMGTVLGFTLDSAGQSSSVTAQNAYYSVNGYETSSQSNQAKLNGNTFNLMGTTAGTPVNVSVSTNVNAIVQTITDFVQQYNETLQYMQGQYNQVRNYDYQPLTSAQASQMTDQQVSEWNQKAQSGMLENDSLIGGIMTNIENVMDNQIVSGQPTSTVNGQTVTLNSMASIGITPISPITGLSSGSVAPGVTTSGFNSYGLLQINTAQLTAAIQADPTSVMNLFTNSGTGTPTNPSSDTGIGKLLYNAVSSSISQLQTQAGIGDKYDPTAPGSSTTSSNSSTDFSSLLSYTLIDPNADLTTLFSPDGSDISYLGQQISQFDQNALSMNSQLAMLQSRYQQEFSDMESSISQLQTMQTAISSMSSSLG
ncbi:flagellar filament capping protein FliD [Alicyclobacillus dauci]|uniref:Flagellar hook-associated protein 2 n=1 Tax=Alicyclobacillus dauci TaxID=1475485 RepID=A0ABY6Z475_9BACL|nr:flagellar filament capping protein FliD [Alicyclobacillus dauci]WAH37688.1 flagellar filament capping protein FliD [Alicyclobacillus dauci]